MHDNDPWVSVVSGMLRNYPRQGTINYEFQSNSSTFMDLVNEIKKLGKFIYILIFAYFTQTLILCSPPSFFLFT